MNQSAGRRRRRYISGMYWSFGRRGVAVATGIREIGYGGEGEQDVKD